MNKKNSPLRALLTTLTTLTILALHPSITQANPIAFPNLEIDGTKYRYVVVYINPPNIEYTLNGITTSSPFEALPETLKEAVKPYLPKPKTQGKTIEQSNKEEPKTNELPKLNSEQIAHKAHRELATMIQEKLSYPESYSKSQGGFYKVPEGIQLTHKFRAKSPRGRMRSYTVEALCNEEGEILSINWQNQDL
jgi:hypothetical protein